MRLYPVGGAKSFSDEYPRKASNKKKNTSKASRITVDIVTGKETVCIYFDPASAIGFTPPSEEWVGEHLYVPASIVKREDETGIVHVKIPSGETFKLPQSSAINISAQADEGYDDILKLHDFSEMSLVHTLRVRYNRDDIYTLVGPILISINPYKWVEGLYNDELIAACHGKQKVLSLLDIPRFIGVTGS